MKILVLFTLINLAFMQCDNYSIESDCIINNNQPITDGKSAMQALRLALDIESMF